MSDIPKQKVETIRLECNAFDRQLRFFVEKRARLTAIGTLLAGLGKSYSDDMVFKCNNQIIDMKTTPASNNFKDYDVLTAEQIKDINPKSESQKFVEKLLLLHISLLRKHLPEMMVFIYTRRSKIILALEFSNNDKLSDFYAKYEAATSQKILSIVSLSKKPFDSSLEKENPDLVSLGFFNGATVQIQSDGDPFTWVSITESAQQNGKGSRKEKTKAKVHPEGAVQMPLDTPEDNEDIMEGVPISQSFAGSIMKNGASTRKSDTRLDDSEATKRQRLDSSGNVLPTSENNNSSFITNRHAHETKEIDGKNPSTLDMSTEMPTGNQQQVNSSQDFARSPTRAFPGQNKNTNNLDESQPWTPIEDNRRYHNLPLPSSLENNAATQLLDANSTYEFCIKGKKVSFFSLDGKENFGPIFRAYKEDAGYDKNVTFKCMGKAVTDNDSPLSIGALQLTTYNTIEVFQELVTFVLEDKDKTQEPIYLKAKPTTKLKKVFDIYCRKVNLPTDRLVFLFHGKPLKRTDTPLDVGLLNGSRVQVIILPVGSKK